MTIVLLLLLLVSASPPPQIARQRWAGAERDIRRVAPEHFPGLPAQVGRYLRRHGYTIPQLYDVSRPHNAVRGHFNGDGAWDWAVLGSRGGTSTILVFWGGSTAHVTKLAPRADSGYLQTTAKDTIGYSRGLGVVGRDYILEHYRAYGGPKPPPIRHDAIEDGFAEKASEVYYFDGRRWHRLQGAD